MSLREIKETVAAVKPTSLDRVIGYFSPSRGMKRYKARVAMAISGAYKGASRSRKATQTWNTKSGDADADTLFDLPTLRERSRDLVRNNPLASGAINTKVANVVGTGLKLQSQINAEFLGLTEEAAGAWQSTAEREFNIWAESEDCDITRTLNFYGLQELAFRSTVENGDSFATLPFIDRTNKIYSLVVQLIEADRVCNEHWKADTKEMAGGISRDKYGAPTHIHVMSQHPGAVRRGAAEWDKLKVFGPKTGRRNVLHLYRKLRIGQTRGVPDFSPVVEALKQLGDYTEAELTAAVVSGMFAVFVHTEGDFSLEEIAAYKKEFGQSGEGEIKLGSGSVIDLGPNEKVESTNPGRPNSAFDPFVQAILRQVGAALEIPYELLIMQFNISYSASKAAFETAHMFFRNRRKWLADEFCRPIYEAWMYEAVGLGRIKAPGFMRDQAIRQAYLGSLWIGPSKMVLDIGKEVKGRIEMEDRGYITASQNTSELTGGDWEANHRQRAKEIKMQKEAGTLPPKSSALTLIPKPDEPDDDDNNPDNKPA